MQTASDTAPAAAPVLHAREGSTTILTLNRPDKMNALSAELVEALLQAIEEAGRDGTRMLVLRGAGRNFSAGFDFGGFEQASEGDLLLRFVRIEQLLQAVWHAPFVTVALAHGKNFGAGADLICACSHRIGSADSSYRMPGLRFGLVLGTRRLVQRIGQDAARDVLQASRTFDGAEAQHMGFLSRTAAPEEWPDVLAELAGDSSALAPDTTATLLRVTAPDTRDADLAELVRSAAQPGIKERIRAYRAG